MGRHRARDRSGVGRPAATGRETITTDRATAQAKKLEDFDVHTGLFWAPSNAGAEDFAALGIYGDKLDALLLEDNAQPIAGLRGQRLLAKLEIAQRFLRHARSPGEFELAPAEQGSARPDEISR